MEKSQSYKYAIPTGPKTMWKSVSIHILKNTQANKPYGTEDRQVRKTLKSAKFVKSAIQTKTNTEQNLASEAGGPQIHCVHIFSGFTINFKKKI